MGITKNFFLFLIGFSFLLSGCKTPKPVTHSLSPYGAMISLDVGDFLIIDDSKATIFTQTRIYPNSLSPEIQSWASLRLKADGTQGKAVLRILDARVIEENIDDLLKGNKGPATLSINVILGFEILMPTATAPSKMEFRLHDTLAITPKEFDIENRATIWQNFVQKSLNKINKQFESLLYETFPKVVLLTPTNES